MIITTASYVRTVYCSCNLWKIALNEKIYQSILTTTDSITWSLTSIPTFQITIWWENRSIPRHLVQETREPETQAYKSEIQSSLHNHDKQ